MRIGIDVSRNRSGGAKAHIIGLLTNINQEILSQVDEIHVWGYSELLNSLPNEPWLVKHCPEVLSKNIVYQLWWQFYTLPQEIKKYGLDILFNTDAGSVCLFKPSVTLSQDMLSYEKGEIDRYGLSLQKIRLYLLRYIQNRSLKKSTSAIFLTEYAREIIQEYTGPISESRVINHGVNESFDIGLVNKVFKNYSVKQEVKCVYVSTVDFYKHQWTVANSVASLRKKGYDITCTFIGGGKGKPQQKLQKTLSLIPDSGTFLKQLEFVEHSKLPDLLQEYDVFIFASSCENMPITLIEGMRVGLPIACSARGPMPEVLKDAGVYFDPEDPHSLSKALVELIEKPNLRSKLAHKSYELSKQYTWERCSKETFEYIIEIIKKYEK